MSVNEKLKYFGITSLGNKFSEEKLARLEKELGCRLPDDYRDFLKNHGQSEFESWVVFPTPGGGVYPGLFVGSDLAEAISDNSERLPNNFIPINNDGGGNLIVMSLEACEIGAIYFHHHSIGVDSESEEEKKKTLAFLSPNFRSFILGLEIDE